MIQERDEVVLTCDEGRGYEVEFMTLHGETIGVSTLRAHQVRHAVCRQQVRNKIWA